MVQALKSGMAQAREYENPAAQRAALDVIPLAMLRDRAIAALTADGGRGGGRLAGAGVESEAEAREAARPARTAGCAMTWFREEFSPG